MSATFPEGPDYTGPAARDPIAQDRPRLTDCPERASLQRHGYLVSPHRRDLLNGNARAGCANARRGRDDLELVRVRYDRTECGEAVAGEALLGGETPTYLWCRAIVSGTRIFFGEDPIESITLTRYGTAK